MLMGLDILTSNRSRDSYNVVDCGNLSSIQFWGIPGLPGPLHFTTAWPRTLVDAAVQLRRLAVLLDGQDGPILGLQAVLDDQRETVRRLLASALAVVEAAGEPMRP